jgi:hypothetical protein
MLKMDGNPEVLKNLKREKIIGIQLITNTGL